MKRYLNNRKGSFDVSGSFSEWQTTLTGVP